MASIPDGSTLTGLATLVAAIFAGIVSVINAIVGARGRNKLTKKVEEVHTDTKTTVSNTNGQLTTAQAENSALRENNRLLQEQVRSLSPRPNRATDPPGPGAIQPPPSGAIRIGAHAVTIMPVEEVPPITAQPSQSPPEPVKTP